MQAPTAPANRGRTQRASTQRAVSSRRRQPASARTSPPERRRRSSPRRVGCRSAVALRSVDSSTTCEQYRARRSLRPVTTAVVAEPFLHLEAGARQHALEIRSRQQTHALDVFPALRRQRNGLLDVPVIRRNGAPLLDRYPVRDARVVGYELAPHLAGVQKVDHQRSAVPHRGADAGEHTKVLAVVVEIAEAGKEIHDRSKLSLA